MKNINQAGQALLETCFSILIFMMIFGFSIRFFSNEYNRLFCEKALFEKIRSSLNTNHDLKQVIERRQCGGEVLEIKMSKLRYW